MKTLKVTLKQHTPLIHFQHDQEGATLRASEVKPKLDRYILSKLGDGDYEKGIGEARNYGWLIGKGKHTALDYKIRIVSKERIMDINLNSSLNRDRKWTTEKFPLLLANMGGRDFKDELVNFSLSKAVVIDLMTRNDELYNELIKQIPYFFANTNFGQRANKGFGSFTVEEIKAYDDKEFKIDSRGVAPYYIAESTLYMDFWLMNKVEGEICSIEDYKVIFKVIEAYWKELRNKINKDTKINCYKIDTLETYIKGMKHIVLDENVQRVPAPIIFKPIFYKSEEDLYVSIYIMFDWLLLQQLKLQYKEGQITKSNKLLINEINSLEYIDDFSENMLHSKYGNRRMSIEGRTIDIYFYGQ